MSKIQQRQDIRDYVQARKEAGADAEAIAAEVNEKWPGWKMTARGVHRLGALHRMAWDGEKRPPPANPKPKPTTCIHAWLEDGKLRVCGAKGYQRCPNHKMKTAPQGTKYPHTAKLF